MVKVIYSILIGDDFVGRAYLKHIEGYIKPLQDYKKYSIENLDKLAEYAFAYEVECSCKCDMFKVYLDAHPTVILECVSCGNKICVYDLECYPAAVKLKKDFVIKNYESIEGDKLFKICVIYEYSDEFEYSDDIEFDSNDISWCIVYGYGLYSNRTFQIINDETT